MPVYHLAQFSCDVTPPLGHPLCGGWIEPVRGIDDPLELVGIVLLGLGKPIVLAAIDWCGLRNDAFRIWRAALAEAAHTVTENVVLHCVHPHNAPFADNEAEKLIAAAGGKSSLDLKFFAAVVASSAAALKASLPKAVPITHVGSGLGTVKEVASNRRVIGPDGKVKFTRTSATKSVEAREAPEGLIDPNLRTVSFWDKNRPRAALHFYATHPMSYYGDGRVSADFCGLARRKRQSDLPDVMQIYFTGAAGNVTAGKYNDGAPANRAILRDRVYQSMVDAWKQTRREPIESIDWRIEPVLFPARTEASFLEEISNRDLNDRKQTVARQNNAAYQLAWLKRLKVPIEISSLNINDSVMTLHLPGEPFIEFQLAAQKMRSDATVFVAGYGDGGPGYIPPADAYLQGGYEPTVALAGPGAELILKNAISKLLGQPRTR